MKESEGGVKDKLNEREYGRSRKDVSRKNKN